jgi:phage protein D
MTHESYKPPQINIKINNQEVGDDFLEDVIQLSVEESLHMPSMCTIILKNTYYSGRPQQDRPWKHDNLIAIGKKIEVEMVASKTEAFSEENTGNLFKGEMTGIECHFTDDSKAPIVIRAYDISHRLHRGRFNRSFINNTDSDIVDTIAGETGITIRKIDSTTPVHDYIFQENQTNMEFLRSRAFRLGFELFVQNNELYFRKPKENELLELEWLKDINSFRVRVSSAEQVNSVEVRGWDYQQKKSIVVTKQNEQVLTENEYGKGSQVNGQFTQQPESKMIVVDQPVFKEKEADQIAQAICDELGGEFICAEAKAEGNPEIRVGKVVNLKGATYVNDFVSSPYSSRGGSQTPSSEETAQTPSSGGRSQTQQNMGKYDGKYYITETRHLYHKRVYSTDFTVRGLRGGNLLNLISPSPRLQPAQTLLVGIVTDNQDPENLGRVKVKFPTLTEDHNSNWARVVASGAAKDRGFHCLPEINDEVLVGFEHGNIHRPYIIGNVWNGKDQPPENVDDTVMSNKVRLRTIKTRTGHILQFVEEDKGDSKAGVYITTSKDHKIKINDSDRCVEIETSGGHKVKMDDQNRFIEMKTSGGHKAKMDDMGQSVSIESTLNMTLKAQGNIDIKANGVITVQGQIINLN